MLCNKSLQCRIATMGGIRHTRATYEMRPSAGAAPMPEHISVPGDSSTMLTQIQPVGTRNTIDIDSLGPGVK